MEELNFKVSINVRGRSNSTIGFSTDCRLSLFSPHISFRSTESKKDQIEDNLYDNLKWSIECNDFKFYTSDIRLYEFSSSTFDLDIHTIRNETVQQNKRMNRIHIIYSGKAKLGELTKITDSTYKVKFIGISNINNLSHQ